MKLELPRWTPHHNMIVYSLLFYSEKNNIDLSIVFNNKIQGNSAILYIKGKVIFFDYSDDVFFTDNPDQYDFYFKRSLPSLNFFDNVYPLNFQVNFSYKALSLLKKLPVREIINKKNRIEIFRALDYCNSFTNLSHNAMDVRFFPKDVINNKGKIIFQTRLWNPENHIDFQEKERRRIQNEFRIEGCRIIKKNFKNVSVGLFPDNLSLKIAPDILLDVKKTSKKGYFKSLYNSDICIADDGLKDTPGWKIGEYLLFGKAIISTPITVTVENFSNHVNYEKLSTRNAYVELPEKIEYLLAQNRYLEMGSNNLLWSEMYLHPKNYINRILAIIEKKDLEKIQ